MKPSTSLEQPAAPRFAILWATLVCILAAMTLAYPALSGGFLVAPVSDQYIAGFSFREFAASSLMAGNGLPLWNPYLFGGLPYVAAMHGDIFYPTFLLRLVLPTDIAMTWGMILHLMLAGVAAYAFLRAIGLGFHAALVGGVAYMMSGQVASLVSPGHDGKLFVSALFPLTLLVLTCGIRDAKQWAWGVLALIIGLGVLSPHPQLLQYLLLASGAWALMLAFGRTEQNRLTRSQAFTRLGIALGAIALGLAMGAVQYLPVMEYVDWSPRVGGRAYDYATSYSMPIEELINTFLPQFSGILDDYWGRNGIHLHSEYLGAGVILLAIMGIGARTDDARRRQFWFWTGALALSLIWALGGNTPFYHLVYAIVPGTKYFRAPSTILFVTTFAVAVLAGLGTERVLAGKVSRRYLTYALAVGGAFALLATVGFFQAIGDAVLGSRGFLEARGGNSRVVDQLAMMHDANRASIVAGAWRSFLFLAGVLAIPFAVGTKRLSAAAAGWGLVGLVAADLWSVERLYFNFSPRAAQIFASDPAIEHIRKEKEPVRVIAIELPVGSTYRDPFLGGDALMHHRIRVVEGYHGNEIRHWQEISVRPDRNQLFNPTLWGLGAVKYVYTNRDSLPIEGARRVVGPVLNAAGTSISLFELSGEHPYAWVVPIMAKYPESAVIEAVHATNFPYRSVALLDTTSSTPTMPLRSVPPPLTIKARTTDHDPGSAVIELDGPAPAGSALVVSENFYPGWGALVDGKPVSPERVDLSLIGVPLPAGARRIELRFDSAPYWKGKRVSEIAIVLGALLALGGLLLGWRRRNA